MPDGTIQDQRSTPNLIPGSEGTAAGITWGYLKVKNPNLLREDGGCSWKEYMLFLNLSGRPIGPGDDRTFEVEKANLDFDGNSRLIEIAVIREPGISGNVTRPAQEGPDTFTRQ